MPHFGKKKVNRAAGTPASEPERAEFVKKVRAGIAAKESEYRRRSLELHPWVCAKCGRDYNASNLHLLTVHHKDGNHNNNPPDGSNWENLCVYCHEDEHSRGVLADYAAEAGAGGGEAALGGEPETKPAGGFSQLAAALAKLKEKGK
ncbi:MAG: HNH nuclease family protein [Deltaproteobacteria bacterium]|nr:HNH nuclease family protein [Deltaproteobacteria bacterium]